ncbi:MAG: photosystem I reaction center subunit XII, partial [Streptomyces sp.]
MALSVALHPPLLAVRLAVRLVVRLVVWR